MEAANSLPSPSALYGTYLLGQSYARGHNASWDAWVNEVRRLPTGLAAPRNIENTALFLVTLGLCKVTDSGRVWLDSRIILAGSSPTNEVLVRILVLLSSSTAPVWVQGAVSGAGGVSPEAIPSTEMETLRRLGLGDTNLLATKGLLLALAAPPSTSTEIIGAQGEEEAVAHEMARLASGGRTDLSTMVSRVSLISDRFGYDIESFCLTGDPLRLEVKTSTVPAASRFRFFLTRHEFDVALLQPSSWRLMAVALQAGSARVVGYISAHSIRALVPVEHDGFRWTEARLSVPLDCIAPTP